MFQRSQGGAVCSLKQVPTSVQFAFVIFQEQKKIIPTLPKCCMESSLANISRASFYTLSLMRVFLCVLDSEADGSSLCTSNSQLAYGDVDTLTCLSVLIGKLNTLSFLRFSFFFFFLPLFPLSFNFSPPLFFVCFNHVGGKRTSLRKCSLRQGQLRFP